MSWVIFCMCSFKGKTLVTGICTGKIVSGGIFASWIFSSCHPLSFHPAGWCHQSSCPLLSQGFTASCLGFHPELNLQAKLPAQGVFLKTSTESLNASLCPCNALWDAIRVAFAEEVRFDGNWNCNLAGGETEYILYLFICLGVDTCRDEYQFNPQTVLISTATSDYKRKKGPW